MTGQNQNHGSFKSPASGKIAIQKNENFLPIKIRHLPAKVFRNGGFRAIAFLSAEISIIFESLNFRESLKYVFEKIQYKTNLPKLTHRDIFVTYTPPFKYSIWSDIQLTVAIIIGGVLQLAFFASNLLKFSQDIGSQGPLFIPDYSPYFVFVYFLFGLGYCWVVTSILRPKRLVPPLGLQFVTVSFGLATMAISYYLWLTTNFQPVIYSSFYKIWFVYFALGFSVYIVGFAFILSIIQTELVKILAGLNMEGVFQETYQFHADFATCKSILEQSFVQRNYGFKIRESNENMIILTMKNDYNDVLYIGIERDEAYPADSILCLATYTLWNWRIDTRLAEQDMLYSFRNDFAERVRQVTGLNPLGKAGIVAPISGVISAYSVEKTKTKLGDIRNFWQLMPTIYKFGIGITISLYVFTVLVTFDNTEIAQFLQVTIPTPDFLNATIFTVVALVAEFGLALREEISAKTSEFRRRR